MKTFGYDAPSTSTCTHPERQRRRDEAAERQAEYNKLTTKEKLDRAIVRGGEDTREVKRLRARLEVEVPSEAQP